MEEKNVNQTKYYYIIILALAFLTYSQTLFFNYVYLDDDGIILEHFSRISTWDKIDDAFVGSYIEGNYYRPLIIISFLIDAQIGGQNPLFYHLSNIILHSIFSCLVFLLLLKLQIKKIWAFVLSSLFAISPLMSNAVAWIAGRNDIIVALFSVLSIIFLIQFIETKRWYHLVFHILTLCFALLSKEIALMLPIIYFLYYYLFQKGKKLWVNKYILYAFWIILPSIYVFVRSGMTENQIPTGVIPFLSNLFIIFEELSKAFFPFNLKVFPDYNLWLTLSGLVIAIFLCIYFFRNKNKNKKIVLFGFIWFILFLSPTLVIRHVAPDGGFNYLDCRVYLPFIGILIILSEIVRNTKKENVKKVFLTISILIGLFFIVNQIESQSYKNGENFWKSTINDYPNRAFYYRGLAHYYSTQKNFTYAAIYQEKAIATNPNILKYYHEAAVYYNQLGLFTSAIEKLNLVMKLERNRYDSYVTILYLYGKMDRKDSCSFYINKLINEINDQSKVDSILLSISSTLQSERKQRMAKYFVQKAYEFNSNNADVLNYLAIYEYLDGNISDSEKHLREAIKIDPKNLDYKRNLHKILQKG